MIHSSKITRFANRYTGDPEYEIRAKSPKDHKTKEKTVTNNQKKAKFYRVASKTLLVGAVLGAVIGGGVAASASANGAAAVHTAAQTNGAYKHENPTPPNPNPDPLDQTID
ncbi:MAG: hypothetical protein Q4C71_06215, partial [Microbacteriaceae bacterium]|nr:hypothetical protein [Microbacteriaceae bacterium]